MERLWHFKVILDATSFLMTPWIPYQFRSSCHSPLSLPVWLPVKSMFPVCYSLTKRTCPVFFLNQIYFPVLIFLNIFLRHIFLYSLHFFELRGHGITFLKIWKIMSQLTRFKKVKMWRSTVIEIIANKWNKLCLCFSLHFSFWFFSKYIWKFNHVNI